MCSWEGRGIFLFPCHKGLFSSDGVLVGCVLPRTWVEDILVGRWEGHAWPLG